VLSDTGPDALQESRRFHEAYIPMLAVIQLVLLILNILWWIIIASAVLSWLFAFNIVNPRNQFVGMIGEFLYRVTEPIYRPIRRVLPDLGGIDLSPLVVLLGIFFLQQLIIYSIAPVLLGM
jgi:YggT family protein